MTKARDLANAGTALTTVSATELGYLDGVTSAVQTQINSKIGQSTAINPTIVDAKGDIVAATAADTVARLAVGANDTVLTADSSTATGLKWAAAAAGGKVLQVVQGTYSTEVTITNTNYTDTGLSATITPSSSTSKILVLTTQKYFIYTTTTPVNAGFQLIRGASVVNDYLLGAPTIWAAVTSGQLYFGGFFNISYLDSPATTSSITYKVQSKVENSGSSRQIGVNTNNTTSSMILMEIGA